MLIGTEAFNEFEKTLMKSWMEAYGETTVHIKDKDFAIWKEYLVKGKLYEDNEYYAVYDERRVLLFVNAVILIKQNLGYNAEFIFLAGDRLVRFLSIKIPDSETIRSVHPETYFSRLPR